MTGNGITICVPKVPCSFNDLHRKKPHAAAEGLSPLEDTLRVRTGKGGGGDCDSEKDLISRQRAGS